MKFALPQAMKQVRGIVGIKLWGDRQKQNSKYKDIVEPQIWGMFGNCPV